MLDTTPYKEKAILIGVAARDEDFATEAEYLEELAFLVETAGGIPLKKFIQKLEIPDARTYVGKGKLQQIREYLGHHEADLAVFDDELTPSQIRNIERVLQCRIIDRNNLILDIFARRARSSYARTQVELAQNEYLLPRLTRMWTHLEKQRGGIGLRGPGEQEIETDRRILRYRISLLKKKLAAIDRQKATQRKSRKETVRVALVGYTNVGKSTLMNVLSKSSLFAEDKLFATLDTTIRKVVIGESVFLLSDTVGFIRKLPHTLIESFKSTLDEVREADILLHIIDISHPDFEEQIGVVNQTLSDIGATGKITLMVFNKIDAYRFTRKDPDDLGPVERHHQTLRDLEKTWMAKENFSSVFISATKEINIDTLRERIRQEVKKIRAGRYPFPETAG